MDYKVNPKTIIYKTKYYNQEMELKVRKDEIIKGQVLRDNIIYNII